MRGRARFCVDHDDERKQSEKSGAWDPGFYSRKAWRRMRAHYLRNHPMCAVCGELAAHVHHVIPRRERPDLSLAVENLEALCAECHGREHGSRKG